MIIRLEDDSLIDLGDKVLFFSLDRFKEEICTGDRCFICGASPIDTDFNEEHVLPNWILRRYKLHESNIGLPNGSNFRYRHYKVGCCKSCNALMGETIERPIQELIDQGYEAVMHHIAENGPWLFFVWLNLIYFKTHYKDRHLRIDKDLRSPDERIADPYEWANLHHIHCVARSFFTGIELDISALGTFWVLPALKGDSGPSFDFADLYLAQTIMMRIEDIAFIAVLNDSCGVMSIWGKQLNEVLDKLGEPLHPEQIREILARTAYANLLIREPPTFSTFLDPISNSLRIVGNHPAKVSIDEHIDMELGKIFYHLVQDVLPAYESDIPTVVELVKTGKFSFLL